MDKQFEDFYNNLDQKSLSDIEFARAFWQAGRASMRDEAESACFNEHLEDPTCTDDDAYDNAVDDCVRSIKAIQP